MKLTETQHETIEKIQEVKRLLEPHLKAKTLTLAKLKQHNLKIKHYRKIIFNLANELKSGVEE